MVLVVDDNDDVRRLVRKVLERAGKSVIEASDGEAALAVVETTIPDLVLMDIRLPGKYDGLQATLRMKEDPRMSRVPIVALTASVLAVDREKALASGCSGFIGKPIDITLLPALVEKYIVHGPGAKPR
jgi:two-component system cell cycle response regulator DivK